MKKLTPALSVASMLFAFPLAAQVVEIGGATHRPARRGEKVFYVGGAAATVVDEGGRVVGRIVAEGEGYALMGADGAVVARAGERARSAPAELRHARWVLGSGALDIRGTEPPLVLMTAETNRASLRA